MKGPNKVWEVEVHQGEDLVTKVLVRAHHKRMAARIGLLIAADTFRIQSSKLRAAAVVAFKSPSQQANETRKSTHLFYAAINRNLVNE